MALTIVTPLSGIEFIAFIGLLVTSVLAAPPAIGIPGAMPCMSRHCDFDSDPVCAVDDSGVALTFSNRCMAELANCISGICMLTS